MKFKLNQKVKILSSKKADESYNYGYIIGFEYVQNAAYLCFFNEKQYIKSFVAPYYKVCYVDCVTKRGEIYWFAEKDLEIYKKISKA